MLKKIIILLNIFVLSISSFSCVNNNKNNTNDRSTISYETTRKQEAPKLNTKSKNTKNEVIVITFTGFDNTVNDYGSVITDYYLSDSVEIFPKETYKEEDLKDAINGRIAKENLENIKPEILNEKINLNKYKYIFVGFPIWNDNIPQIIYTFSNNNNFSNKIIIPFAVTDNDITDELNEKIKEYFKNAEVKTIKTLPVQLKMSILTHYLDELNLDISLDDNLKNDITEEELEETEEETN